MPHRQIQSAVVSPDTMARLQNELADARNSLREAEKALAEEQAAVNAFRLHCRLTIGHWVDTLIELQTEKQSLLTRWQLLQQDLEPDEPEFGIHYQANFTETDTPMEAGVDSLASAILEELVNAEKQRAAEKRLYRQLARRFHPDLAANRVEMAYRTSIMAAINGAYQQHDLQTLRDLAGEHEPQLIAEIEDIQSEQIRSLRRQILRCQRLQRKVGHQLRALRQENTAKLWQKAQQLEVTGNSNWWHQVKRSLAQDVDRLQDDISKLAQALTALEVHSAESDYHLEGL